jgi:hypothetical protein
MRYTPSITAITFLTLLLDPVSSLPVQPNNDLHVRRFPLEDHTLNTRSPIAALDTRSLEERQSYGFGTPTEHAGLGTAVERPNPCGTGCTTRKLKPRQLSAEELRMRHVLRKRSSEDGEFITNVEFVPE